MKLKIDQKNLIRKAAEAMAKFTEKVVAMDEKELRALIHECDALNQTNCWWLEYRIAPILKREAEEALSILLRKADVATAGA